MYILFCLVGIDRMKRIDRFCHEFRDGVNMNGQTTHFAAAVPFFSSIIHLLAQANEQHRQTRMVNNKNEPPSRTVNTTEWNYSLVIR